ncbi:hypothetical protein CEXT_550531 [Caerostris extrusa]|uniref:Uncharacterized protein n=1 Tax=Caerostris extrusa TaxID=172846 RepID=A0AAV4TP36_CAEEX|nr:hypothetical protein CEXT_550531 [Caerostris extrusa]
MTYPMSQVIPFLSSGKELSRFPGADHPISLQERFRSKGKQVFFTLPKSPKKRMRKWAPFYAFIVCSYSRHLQLFCCLSDSIVRLLPSEYFRFFIPRCTD